MIAWKMESIQMPNSRKKKERKNIKRMFLAKNGTVFNRQTHANPMVYSKNISINTLLLILCIELGRASRVSVTVENCINLTFLELGKA